MLCMLNCINFVPEETGWEKLPIREGGRVRGVRPATAAPAGETCVLREQEDFSATPSWK